MTNQYIGKVKGPCCCLGGSFCASDFKLLDKNHVEHAKFRRDGALGKGILRSAATTSDRYELDFEDRKSLLAEYKEWINEGISNNTVLLLREDPII